MDSGGYKVAKYRTLSEKNKYYIPKEDYLTAIHYSLRYPLWVAEMDTNADTRGAIRYDKDKIQSSNDYDSTEAVGIKRAELSEKIKLVEDMIEIACDISCFSFTEVFCREFVQNIEILVCAVNKTDVIFAFAEIS